MTAPGLDKRLHRDALVALLSPVLGGHIYDYGAVPGAKGPDGSTNPGILPDNYTLLSLERAFIVPAKMTRRPHRSSWRLTLRYVGRLLDNARDTEKRITTTVEGVRITVDGNESTPLSFETADDIAPDEGRFSGALVYTYLL